MRHAYLDVLQEAENLRVSKAADRLSLLVELSTLDRKWARQEHIPSHVRDQRKDVVKALKAFDPD